jgi:hypothetical protein
VVIAMHRNHIQKMVDNKDKVKYTPNTLIESKVVKAEAAVVW